MIEILEFVFRDFLTWAGTAILLAAPGMGLSGMIIINQREKEKEI